MSLHFGYFLYLQTVQTAISKLALCESSSSPVLFTGPADMFPATFESTNFGIFGLGIHPFSWPSRHYASRHVASAPFVGPGEATPAGDPKSHEERLGGQGCHSLGCMDIKSDIKSDIR